MESHVHAYIQVAAALGRETERVGPFLATFSPGSSNPYLNYAVPDHEASPTAQEVTALIDAYRRRQRTPRLEYVASAAPNAQAALLGGGFHIQGRLPLMVCSAGSRRDVAAVADIDVLAATSDAEIGGVVEAAKEAYDGDPSPATDTEIAARRALARRGGILVLARHRASLQPAASGVCEVPWEGLSELAAVAVRPAFRGRGLAAAVTAHLAREAFTHGVETVWLTPGHDLGERIYARVGFRSVGHVLHLSHGAAVMS